MWTSRTGQIIALSPHRVETLLAFARRRGANRLLGVPLGHCGSCTVDAVARRIGELARAARATGSLPGNAGERYSVFESTALGPRHRLLTRAGGDGRYHVIWLDGLPSTALQGSTLGELELEAENEVNRRALKTTLRWSANALDRTAVNKLSNVDAVYIMVVKDPSTSSSWRPVKVGLTTNPTARFKAYARYPTARFFVGVLRDPVTTRFPGQVLPTIEHAVANAIRRVALTRPGVPDLDLTVHRKPIHPFRASGRIEIGNLLPAALKPMYPMKDVLAAPHVRAMGPRFDTIPMDPATPVGTLAIPGGRLFETPASAP